MPVLDYYGDLWGFEVQNEEGTTLLCHNCYDNVKGKAMGIKVVAALGTEDRDEDEPDEKWVYICDGCGEVSK